MSRLPDGATVVRVCGCVATVDYDSRMYGTHVTIVTKCRKPEPGYHYWSSSDGEHCHMPSAGCSLQVDRSEWRLSDFMEAMTRIEA